MLRTDRIKVSNLIAGAIHSSGYRGARFDAKADATWKLNFRHPPYLLDYRPRFTQCRSSRLGVAHDLGIDLEIAKVHRERDPPSLDTVRLEREIELVRDRGRVVAVLACHDIQHEDSVGNGARHRTVGEVGVKRARPAARHPPVGGLQTEDAAARGRNADRTPDVRSVRERRHAGSERRSRPPARSARGEFEVPGVSGHAPEIGMGDSQKRELRRGGSPEENCACVQEPVHVDETPAGTVVLVEPRAVGRGLPLHVVEVLDDDRDPFEGPRVGSTSCVPLLRLPGFVEGAVEERMGEGVDLRLDVLDARDETRDELDRREAPLDEAIACLHRSEVAQFWVGVHGRQCYVEANSVAAVG